MVGSETAEHGVCEVPYNRRYIGTYLTSITNLTKAPTRWAAATDNTAGVVHYGFRADR